MTLTIKGPLLYAAENRVKPDGGTGLILTVKAAAERVKPSAQSTRLTDMEIYNEYWSGEFMQEIKEFLNE